MKQIQKEKDFEALIKEGKVLVDFFATWCGPCQLLEPVLESVEKEIPDLTIIQVDVDEYPELAKAHGVMSIPTLELYQDGSFVTKQLGYISKDELEDLLG